MALNTIFARNRRIGRNESGQSKDASDGHKI